jgi:hypothetical protein
LIVQLGGGGRKDADHNTVASRRINMLDIIADHGTV